MVVAIEFWKSRLSFCCCCIFSFFSLQSFNCLAHFGRNWVRIVAVAIISASIIASASAIIVGIISSSVSVVSPHGLDTKKKTKTFLKVLRKASGDITFASHSKDGVTCHGGSERYFELHQYMCARCVILFVYIYTYYNNNNNIIL